MTYPSNSRMERFLNRAASRSRRPFEMTNPIHLSPLRTRNKGHVNDLICKAAWGERPHFVLNLGDLTDGGQSGNRYEWTHEYFPGIEQLASRVAIFPVVGNGESDLRWYKHYHALPAPEYYYTFTYGNAQFFMLDSNRSLGPNSEQ